MSTVDIPKVAPPSGKDEGPKEKGFFNRPRAGGKTIWDWLNLLATLAIPLAIVIGTAYFSFQQNQTSIQLANDQQQEATLKSYVEDMSDLLLNHNLGNSKPGDEVRQVARERTLTTLRMLKADRNKIVLQFLQDAHLIGLISAVIDLSGANLSGGDLSGANLHTVNLSTDILLRANLIFADLSGADLSNANLFYANLNAAHLSNADLIEAHLTNANLSGADLSGADLSGADLSGADLSGANLSGANPSGANLSGADLSGADLSGAGNLTQQQLDEVHLCNNAILPIGLTCHHNQ